MTSNCLKLCYFKFCFCFHMISVLELLWLTSHLVPGKKLVPLISWFHSCNPSIISVVFGMLAYLPIKWPCTFFLFPWLVPNDMSFSYPRSWCRYINFLFFLDFINVRSKVKKRSCNIFLMYCMLTWETYLSWSAWFSFTHWEDREQYNA